MSILPYIYEDLYPTCQRSGSYKPIEYWAAPIERSLLSSRSTTNKSDELRKKTNIGENGFQARIYVKHFLPNEISIKAKNNSIVVHVKHDEKQDEYGLVSREFTRRYELPNGFKADDVTSNLSADGVLTVKCPPAAATQRPTERHIKIEQINSNNDVASVKCPPAAATQRPTERHIKIQQINSSNDVASVKCPPAATTQRPTERHIKIEQINSCDDVPTVKRAPDSIEIPSERHIKIQQIGSALMF